MKCAESVQGMLLCHVSKMVSASQKELTCDRKWKVPESFTPEL